MAERKDNMPQEIIRPKKDLGYHLSLCQAFAKSRREGRTIALQKEDMWCFEPVLGFGFAKPPEYFLEGHNRYPGTARTIEAGKIWAQKFPCLDYGKYKGIISARLSKTTYVPDVIVVYCNPAQLTQLLIAVNWIDGNDIMCRMSGHAACVYAVVPVIQNNQFQVTSPCMGDRKRASAQDNEIIFSMPAHKTKDLVAG
jgi:uncharacterized protein (DUF169 family)